MTDSTLHADAARILSAWTPSDEAASDTRQRFLDLLEIAPRATRRDNPGAHVTASTLVVHADLDRVLLCLHGRMDRWVQLGGHCEEGDSTLEEAAKREATEESGIDGLLLHHAPIDLDIHEVSCRYGPALHYDVRFAALAPAGAVERISAESRELAWFAPDALPAPLASATDRLIVPALKAARDLQR